MSKYPDKRLFTPNNPNGGRYKLYTEFRHTRLSKHYWETIYAITDDDKRVRLEAMSAPCELDCHCAAVVRATTKRGEKFLRNAPKFD